jgi:hypothetical protein
MPGWPAVGKSAMQQITILIFRCFRWNGRWAILKVQAPDSASPLAICRFPACRRPSKPSLAPQKTELLAPYSFNHAPDRPAGRAGASPESRRSTSIPGIEVLRRDSGECPGRLRRGWVGMSGRRGRFPTHSTGKSEQPNLHHKWFSHRSLSALHGRLAGAPA